MTDYKASHPGSITVQFAVKVIDYFFGLKSISPREDSTVIDLGFGEGFFWRHSVDSTAIKGEFSFGASNSMQHYTRFRESGWKN